MFEFNFFFLFICKQIPQTHHRNSLFDNHLDYDDEIVCNYHKSGKTWIKIMIVIINKKQNKKKLYIGYLFEKQGDWVKVFHGEKGKIDLLCLKAGSLKLRNLRLKKTSRFFSENPPKIKSC